jgi:hypothetical protein
LPMEEQLKIIRESAERAAICETCGNSTLCERE